jgi:hypothetical protein
MLPKRDNRAGVRLWSSGVPLRRDIPVSMPSPATDPGFNRFQLAGTGEPSFRGLLRPWG